MILPQEPRTILLVILIHSSISKMFAVVFSVMTKFLVTGMITVFAFLLATMTSMEEAETIRLFSTLGVA